ncbi:hypothetical protein Poly24_15520 [Rosistilla carotiformis]|uniref:Uncharacterized protein n=1 Tax=Rosistilla carotiformis TaxID=2528017 RepID=A0A518JQP2_9BACT|nr:hypothetical protein [Rosistilla carotiformis]QDV67848.1 hypothetical protein Poly24_15520 [Rosistilla carotiformis]
MMWFYGWCAFIASIVLAVPVAALLEKRAEAGPSTRRGKETAAEEEGIDEAESIDEAEEAEFVDDAEVAEFAEEAEVVMDLGDPADDFEELR